jgi:hypothetical protein
MGTIWNNPDGLRVHFGTRRTGEEAGFGAVATETGFEKVLVFDLRGSDFSGTTYIGPTGAVKAGIIVRNVTVEVFEVFNLGGTSPVINVGVQGSEGTNRFAQISESQAETVGTYSITPAGTLAAGTPLAADQTINVTLGGTSPTITSAGRLRVIVNYTNATPV